MDRYSRREPRDRFPIVVHVMVFDGQRLALLKRSNTGFMDGFYALPGGHQERGESVSGAASRECEEELGLLEVNVMPVCVLPYRSGSHQGVNFIFETRDYAGTARVNEPELFDELIWVAPSDLPEPHADWLPKALGVLNSEIGEGWYGEMEWD